MKTTKASLYPVRYLAEAVSNWPEDEAYACFYLYQERVIHDCDNDEDREYEQICFTKDCERMRRIIESASEGDASLVLRFNAKLNELFAGGIKE